MKKIIYTLTVVCLCSCATAKHYTDDSVKYNTLGKDVSQMSTEEKDSELKKFYTDKPEMEVIEKHGQIIVKGKLNGREFEMKKVAKDDTYQNYVLGAVFATVIIVLLLIFLSRLARKTQL